MSLPMNQMSQPTSNISKNYLQAITWIDNQLQSGIESGPGLDIKPGEKIVDTKLFLETSRERIIHGSPRDQRMAFRRVKELKDRLNLTQ